MKIYLSALIATAGLFATTTSSAQMPGQRGYGSPSMSQTRMDRGIGVAQYSNGKKKKSTEKVDLLEDVINHLEKELTLDTFQKTVIKDMLVDNQAEETKVLAEEIPDESKLEKVLILRQKLNEKIKPILSKDQMDLFVKLKQKQDKNRI